MALTITALTDNQAQHGMMYLYQELPLRLWPMAKPKFTDLKKIKNTILNDANDEQKKILTKIIKQDYPSCGSLAKAILFHLEFMEDYAPFIEGAVHYCTQPRMSPAPAISVDMLLCGLVLFNVQYNNPNKTDTISVHSLILSGLEKHSLK